MISFHGPRPSACSLEEVLGFGRGLNRLHVCFFRSAWLAVCGSSQRYSDTVDGFPERRQRRIDGARNGGTLLMISVDADFRRRSVRGHVSGAYEVMF